MSVFNFLPLMDLFLKVLRMKNNPYVWDKSALDINIEMLSIELTSDEAEVKVSNLSQPIKVSLAAAGNIIGRLRPLNFKLHGKLCVWCSYYSTFNYLDADDKNDISIPVRGIWDRANKS